MFIICYSLFANKKSISLLRVNTQTSRRCIFVNLVKRCTILITLALMGWGNLSYGETLFIDDFENGLSQWVGKSSANPERYAKLVDDPLNQGHGKVITFTSLVIEGAVYTKELLRNRPDYKPYILSFDYLGLAKKRGKRW
ncbi:hypothetical protein BGP_5108 [Beggiatoa sp. PS]|nr:hypothetical protein BGP_5108 [Beggiatoa sp. PS]